MSKALTSNIAFSFKYSTKPTTLRCDPWLLFHIRGHGRPAEWLYCWLGQHHGTATYVAYKKYSKAGLLYCFGGGEGQLLSWVPERPARFRIDCLSVCHFDIHTVFGWPFDCTADWVSIRAQQSMSLTNSITRLASYTALVQGEVDSPLTCNWSTWAGPQKGLPDSGWTVYAACHFDIPTVFGWPFLQMHYH